jgi:CAAX prenyl protease-like protein
MFTYVALGALDGYLPAENGQPSSFWYPLVYAVRVVIVGILFWHFRATWADFRPWPKPGAIALAVGVGLLVWGAWIGLDGHYPSLAFLGKRGAFDVGTLAPPWRAVFVAVRLLGLVVLVPLVEELFWRSFLMRWLVDPDFHEVPVGHVTTLAAAITSVMFALAHPEWLPALLTGLAWAWLLWRTKSLAACAVSHATANLALGLYVIATGDWKYW